MKWALTKEWLEVIEILNKTVLKLKTASNNVLNKTIKMKWYIATKNMRMIYRKKNKYNLERV
jgi:hypothetical protein